MPETPAGWHERGYLPHYDDGRSLQAITYRLADALPVAVVARLEEQTMDDIRRRKQIESYLDAGHGSCLLRAASNAAIVVEAWRYFAGQRYQLHAWVVMPNHVHVLVEPMNGVAVSDIVHAQKSYTAKALLRRIGAGGTPALPRGSAWQPDYQDRFIRNERHYKAAVDYIHQNPVQAGLVARAIDWPWSSAADWERGRPARLS